jgi:hypothetical protein
MKIYNRIMEYVWLLVTIFIFVLVTYMGIKDGFDTWWFYYFLGLLTLASYLVRRWMHRRMVRHQEWLKQQSESTT